MLVTRFQDDKILSLGFLFSPVCLLQICEHVWGLSAAAVKMYPLWCGFSFFKNEFQPFSTFTLTFKLSNLSSAPSVLVNDELLVTVFNILKMETSGPSFFAGFYALIIRFLSTSQRVMNYPN